VSTLDPIPWYRSQVYVGAIVSLLTQLTVLFGVAHLVTPADIQANVDAALQLVALASAAYAAYKRQRSDVQPLTLTKAAADQQSKHVQSHPLVGALLLVALVAGLAGCQSSAVAVAETPEQRAAALLGEFTVYQRASLAIVEDPTVAPDIRRRVGELAVAAKPVADQLDASLRLYRAVLRELEAGDAHPDKVAIASANLDRWLLELAQLLANIRTTLQGIS
jgi:hypothetical protein